MTRKKNEQKALRSKNLPSKGTKKFANRKSKKSKKHIRVGDDYLKEIRVPNSKGINETKYIPIKRQTIVDDYGISFLKTIKKFDTGVNIPNYLAYKPEIKGCFNWFRPLEYTLEQGNYKTCLKLMKHIFGEHLELGLDYIKLLYTKPLQNVPILVLVSSKQHTGKTTFIDFLQLIFGANMIIISTSDIEGGFNMHYATMHIIAVDESDLHKKNTTSKIKQMATQRKVILNGKYQTQTTVDFFGRFIFLSNNERTFINIKEDDIRYWVRKVHTFKKYDPDFFEKLEREMPAFVHFIVNRRLSYPKAKSRTWFAEEDYITEWANAAKEENKSELFHELREKFDSFFAENNNDLTVRASDIQRELLNNNIKYSAKWIASCLRDEFKVKSEHMRAKGTYLLNNEMVLGRWFNISPDDVGIIPHEKNESDDELPF